MSDREALIDAFSEVSFSDWPEVQSFVEGKVADAILSSDWLAAHDAEKRAEWEAEQGDKPAPCVMTHTPPFDFAQCETHDETFPLGGACKWYGKESIYEVLEGETDEQRMRAVRAEHQLEILRAEQCKTEYMVSDGDGNVWALTSSLEDARHYASQEPGAVIETRTCTPWLPVPDTTNNEGRAEHDLDRMGICTRCGHGVTARELLDGDEQCTTNNESEGDK